MDDIKFIIMFGGDAVNRFEAFKAEKSSNKIKGRDAIAKALRKKKNIKDLFRELPGGDRIFVANTTAAQKHGERSKTIIPVPDLEALGVSDLTSEQREILREKGAAIIPNEPIERLTAVKMQKLDAPPKSESDLWHLPEILGGCRRERWGKNVRVGIIDTGINNSHREFSNTRIVSARVRGHRTEITTGVDVDPSGHGTAVASLVCGKTLGVAPSAELAVCDVFDGKFARPLDILRGISWLKNNPFGDGRGVQVINLSLGISGYTDIFREAIADAVTFDEIVFCGAVGNGGRGSLPASPACYNEVLSIGAYDSQKAPASFSSVGQARPSDPVQPDFWAPGAGVCVATSDGGYAVADGTSFASPLAAGLVAREMSLNNSQGLETVGEAIHMHAVEIAGLPSTGKALRATV